DAGERKRRLDARHRRRRQRRDGEDARRIGLLSVAVDGVETIQRLRKRRIRRERDYEARPALRDVPWYRERDRGGAGVEAVLELDADGVLHLRADERDRRARHARRDVRVGVDDCETIELTVRRAAVARGRVAVVALLPGIERAVAARRCVL